jgi:hypothetical protein
MRQRGILLFFSALLGGSIVWFLAGSVSHGEPTADPGHGIVYLGLGLDDEQLAVLTSSLATVDPAPVLLLDGPKAGPHIKDFLKGYSPKQIITIARGEDDENALARRLGRNAVPLSTWERGQPLPLWRNLFEHPARIVVCPCGDRRLLLQCACLAGILKAPLFVLHSGHDAEQEFRSRLAEWHPQEVWAAGLAAAVCRRLAEAHKMIALESEAAVTDAYLHEQRKQGPIATLVLANPADAEKGFGNVSCLAPWVALQRQAALLFSNDTGSDATQVVARALARAELAEANALILLADLKALPMEQRPNPVPGKDAVIEMEPLTPAGSEPCTLATGRLFHDDPGVLTLILARQRLLEQKRGTSRKALVVSNPGGGLALLETFSRSTANELRNCGYQTTALFENQVTRDEVRRLLPVQDLFLWEGHYRTLVDHYGMPQWTEPLPPALVFLQSCLALNPPEAQPLLERGAVALVGSSTRTYSGSGGAFTLAFFDAFLYDHASLGGSLRQAKNFLLAYSILKQKRLGEKATLAGANLRSAWAFSLWGDPTLTLPQPRPPDRMLPPIVKTVHGNVLTVHLPRDAYPRVTSNPYQVQVYPNSRLAGLLTRDDLDVDDRNLVPFLFEEVQFPQVPAGKTPHLTSRLPSRNWTFCWDGRRKTGYLLVAPRSRDQELQFRLAWD